jgi:hypothetical protein
MGPAACCQPWQPPRPPIHSRDVPPTRVEAMDPRQQSAKQLAETLVAVLTRCRHRATDREWDAIEEAVCGLAGPEGLGRQPDLGGCAGAIRTNVGVAGLVAARVFGPGLPQ